MSKSSARRQRLQVAFFAMATFSSAIVLVGLDGVLTWGLVPAMA